MCCVYDEQMLQINKTFVTKTFEVERNFRVSSLLTEKRDKIIQKSIFKNVLREKLMK